MSEQTRESTGKCPFMGGQMHTTAGAPSNADWWPNQLKLSILHQHSEKSDPMGGAFNYAEAFKTLDLDAVVQDLQALMTAALTASGEALMPKESETIISGEKNLLDVDDLSSNMRRLRELFDLFEQRTALVRLLDLSQRAEGVRLYIGQESGIATLDECSVVTAPYQVEGQVVGSVGVIGPTRMAYDRVIPIVDITARLLSSALTEQAQG